MKIRIPSFIKPGCTIGIAAPSFGCTTEPYSTKFNSAVKKLEERGYKIKAGECVFKSDGKGISTAPETAAKELMEFYLDSSIDAVISAGGGELMCETAGFIDFERLKDAAPKFFMGYSDNTNFIFPLITIAHTAAVYGPCISGLGKSWEQSETDAVELLEGTKKSVSGYEKFQLPEDDTNEDPTGTYNLTATKELKYFNADNQCEMEGILLGGCLDVLANLCGTKLDNVKEFRESLGDKKIIWVLESCDGNPCEIRRQMWHLKNAGWFENAAGFLTGRPLSAFKQEMMGINQYNAVTDLVADLNVPVIMDADIGHIDPAMPLLMGVSSKIKACGNSINIEFSL